MLTYYAHYTICLHSPRLAHNTPRIWGLSKPCQYPLGNTPRNWGARGQMGSGSNQGNRVGWGYFRGFFAPKNNFFLGGQILRVFRLTCGKIVGKIKKFGGRRVQPDSPTLFPRSSHVLFNCWVGCHSHDSYPCVRENLEGFSLIHSVQHCGKVVGC